MFEGEFEDRRLQELVAELRKMMQPRTDRLHVYRMCEACYLRNYSTGYATSTNSAKPGRTCCVLLHYRKGREPQELQRGFGVHSQAPNKPADEIRNWRAAGYLLPGLAGGRCENSLRHGIAILGAEGVLD